MISPEALMQMAIDKCREGLAKSQSPFGCTIAIGDRIVASEHNTVVLTIDITAHAEVNAIRAGNRAIENIFLEGAVVATTCEPCPMCMAALHWARVDTVYYGATIADAEVGGFNELQLPAAELLRQGGSQVKLISGLLIDECKKLFQEWQANPDYRVY
ncbi:MAG: nucleoside deaminase [Pirellulales bacterium]|nr:nucleoside deaminase [Pirellulales bacterium]